MEWPEALGKSTHIEIRGVDSTFSFSFNGEVQCTIDCTGHVLHARTDSDLIGLVSYRTRVHALLWSSLVQRRCHWTVFVSSANRAFAALLHGSSHPC